MPLPTLPSPPTRADPSTFNDRADAFLAALPGFATACNALEQSLQLTSTVATSTTSLSVSTGAKTITTQTGKAWVVGAFLYIVAAASPSNYMVGQVSSYDSATGALGVSVSTANGGGTFASWVIGLSVPDNVAANLSGGTAGQIVKQSGPNSTAFIGPEAVVAIAAAGGAADALTASFTPQISAASNGMVVYVRAASANVTTTPSIVVGTLAAKTIVKGLNAPLVAGDIAGAGHWLALQYDATLDKFVLLNPAYGVSGFVPGMVGMFARTDTPAGFLRMNGSAVAVASYPGLTAAIYCGDSNNASATWGYRCTDSANPSTTRSTTGAYIVLPDARAEFPRGLDDGRGVDSGRLLWFAQAQQLCDHYHNQWSGAGGQGHGGELPLVANYQYRGTEGPILGGGVPGSTGTELRVRNLAFLFCIKF